MNGKHDETKTRCPYLKEVVMIFCEAYPLKKMVPLDRIKSSGRCFGAEFETCSFFREVTSRMNPPPSKPPRSAATAPRQRRLRAEPRIPP